MIKNAKHYRNLFLHEKHIVLPSEDTEAILNWLTSKSDTK